MKNNNVIDKITKEILNSDELSAKLKKLNGIDEIYSFYKNIGSMPSKEEFKEHVFNLITTGDDLKKLSEISLSKIAGGRN